MVIRIRRLVRQAQAGAMITGSTLPTSSRASMKRTSEEIFALMRLVHGRPIRPMADQPDQPDQPPPTHRRALQSARRLREPLRSFTRHSIQALETGNCWRDLPRATGSHLLAASLPPLPSVQCIIVFTGPPWTITTSYRYNGVCRGRNTWQIGEIMTLERSAR